jgi:hypothetical protein
MAAVVKVKSVEVKSNGPLMAAVVKSVEVKGNGPLNGSGSQISGSKK